MAVHLALYQFELRVLALGLSVRSGLGESCLHRGPVLHDLGSERGLRAGLRVSKAPRHHIQYFDDEVLLRYFLVSPRRLPTTKHRPEQRVSNCPKEVDLLADQPSISLSTYIVRHTAWGPGIREWQSALAFSGRDLGRR